MSADLLALKGIIAVCRKSPTEAAEETNTLSLADFKSLVVQLPAEHLIEMATSLDPEKLAVAMADLDPQKLTAILTGLPPVDYVRFVQFWEEDTKAELFEKLPEDLKREVAELLSYPPDSVGAIMDPRVAVVSLDDDAEKALMKIRARPTAVTSAFVVDSTRNVHGEVMVTDLALADPNMPVDQIMQRKIYSLTPMENKEEALELFQHGGAHTIAVIHVDGSLLGVLRQRTLAQTAASEAADDLLTLVGANPDERALSSVGFSASRRLPWLGINLLTAFLASAVVGLFESTIASVSALAVLLPVVAGQSGNTGAQAMAVAIRGLALREIRPRQWFRLIIKEAQVGFINGAALALVTGLSVWWWSKNQTMGLVIAGAMLMSMVLASVSGALVPLALSAVGKDPAQSSSIVLTTITDIVGFFSFLGLATLALSQLQ